MAVSWTRDEVLKLIEIWGDGAIQAQLEGCRRNQEVYDRIAVELREAGFERTGKQCRDKIKKLNGEYRKIKDKRNKTGEGRFPEWDYFDAMDAILGHRPATQPPVLVNSTDGDAASETTGTESQQEDREKSPELEDFQPGVSESSSATSRSATPLPTQRKRKRSKGEKVDTSTSELISKLIKVQEESDERLMKLEEKRLEFEERQLEKEAQQRKEERQFQLRMMQLVMGQGLGPPPAHFDTPEPFGEHSMDDCMYTFQPTEDIDND